MNRIYFISLSFLQLAVWLIIIHDILQTFPIGSLPYIDIDDQKSYWTEVEIFVAFILSTSYLINISRQVSNPKYGKQSVRTPIQEMMFLTMMNNGNWGQVSPEFDWFSLEKRNPEWTGDKIRPRLGKRLKGIKSLGKVWIFNIYDVSNFPHLSRL